MDAQAVWDHLYEGCPAGGDQHFIRPQVQRQAALAEDVGKGVDELCCQKLLKCAWVSMSTICAGLSIQGFPGKHLALWGLQILMHLNAIQVHIRLKCLITAAAEYSA